MVVYVKYLFTKQSHYLFLSKSSICSYCNSCGDYTCVKEGLYRIWCGVNRLGDSGVHTLSDTSVFVNPAGQLLLTRRGKI